MQPPCASVPVRLCAVSHLGLSGLGKGLVVDVPTPRRPIGSVRRSEWEQESATCSVRDDEHLLGVGVLHTARDDRALRRGDLAELLVVHCVPRAGSLSISCQQLRHGTGVATHR